MIHHNKWAALFSFIIALALCSCTSGTTSITQTTNQMSGTVYIDTNTITDTSALYGSREVVNPNIYTIEEAQTETTLYDTLTDKEINMLEVTVQHEVGAFSDEYKTLIAELIYNRLVSEDFPDDIEQVLFQEYQFNGIDYWYTPHFDVDDETKEVVKEVFSQYETSHEATYYYNPELSDYQSVVWFEYSGDVEYCFEYTEEDWGIEYTTRFFK